MHTTTLRRMSIGARTLHANPSKKVSRPAHYAFSPPYKLVLMNDQVNQRSWVERILVQVIDNMPLEEAKKKTAEAHAWGRSTLRVCEMERAETYCQGLRSHGLNSVIEPVTS